MTIIPMSAALPPPPQPGSEAGADRREEGSTAATLPVPPSPPPPPPTRGTPSQRLPRTSSSSPVATSTTAASAAILLRDQQDQRAAAPGPIPPSRRRLRIYPTGRNRNNKWVTREIAALDFLTGLRMRNEAAILAHGARGVGVGGVGGGGGGDDEDVSADDGNASSAAGGRGGGGGTAQETGSVWGREMRKGSGGGGSENSNGEAAGVGAAGAEAKGKRFGDRSSAAGGGGGGNNEEDNDDTDSENGWLDQPLPSSDRRDGTGSGGRPAARGMPVRGGAVASSSAAAGRVSGAVGGPAPARRLRGREAAHVRLPASFRHRMHSLPGHSAAVVRQWEQGLTRQVKTLSGQGFRGTEELVVRSSPLLRLIGGIRAVVGNSIISFLG